MPDSSGLEDLSKVMTLYLNCLAAKKIALKIMSKIHEKGTSTSAKIQLLTIITGQNICCCKTTASYLGGSEYLVRAARMQEKGGINTRPSPRRE